MKVRFLSSTNDNFKELEGQEGELKIGITFLFDFSEHLGDFVPSFDLRRGYMTSSMIRNLNIVEENMNYFIITIKTKNSEYVFSEGIENSKTTLTDEEKDLILLSFVV